MASFDINPSSLASKAAKIAIGQRTIKGLQTATTNQDGGILGWIWNAGSRLIGFAFSAIGNLFKISFTALWGLFVSAAQFIWNFNWYATDDQLNASIQQQWTALGGQLGGTLGNAIGYIGCGFIPAASVFAFNEPLGAHLLANVSEEFADEFLGNVSALSRTVANATVRTLITSYYINARKFIKGNIETIKRFFPGKEKVIDDINKAWGAKNSKPWSFAIALEEKIESIPNEFLRNFLEEFLEEAWEGCVEAGYVLAGSADSWYAQQAIAKQKFPPLGENLTVEIQLNRQNDDAEKIILQAPEAILRGQILDTLSTNQLLADRDIGIVYGTSDEQPVRSLKPEVVLRFYQEKKDRIIGKDSNGKDVSDPNPLSMRLSFRLMNKDESHFVTDVYAKELAAKIYSKLGSPAFRISKGTNLFTYHDYAKGYGLNLWTSTQAEARRVIEQILDIQGHKVDDEKLRIGSRGTTAKKAKEKKTVLGRTEEVTVTGNKTGIVTFKSAHLNIGNGTNPISLVDLTMKKKSLVSR